MADFDNQLCRNTLLTIYKTFIRSHLDYGDMLHDLPNNDYISGKLEKKGAI